MLSALLGPGFVAGRCFRCLDVDPTAVQADVFVRGVTEALGPRKKRGRSSSRRIEHAALRSRGSINLPHILTAKEKFETGAHSPTTGADIRGLLLALYSRGGFSFNAAAPVCEGPLNAWRDAPLCFNPSLYLQAPPTAAILLHGGRGASLAPRSN